jgi:hypothetical protein
MDDLAETLNYLFVELGVERIDDFGSLPFVVFDGSFGNVLKPAS